MYRYLVGLSLFILFAFTGGVSAEADNLGIVCGDSWEAQEKQLGDFNNPVIGFTVVDFSGAGIHWYVTEEETAYLLGFKEFFTYSQSTGERVYVSGHEIGKIFTVPESEWPETTFLDWPNIESAFQDLSTLAPRCRLNATTHLAQTE